MPKASLLQCSLRARVFLAAAARWASNCLSFSYTHRVVASYLERAYLSVSKDDEVVALMTHRCLLPSLLLSAATSVHAQSPQKAEASIPEPTALAAVASMSDTRILWTQAIGDLQATDSSATAAVTAVEMAGGDGRVLRGVIVALDSSDSTDRIYLGESELQLLQDELAELAALLQSERNTRCDAVILCTMGIARCRPSQGEIQAYCPGIWSKPTSERGFVLGTPRSAFLFPSFALRGLTSLLKAAAVILDERSKVQAVAS